MRKALLNDYLIVIKSTINQHLSDVENVDTITDTIFDYYEKMGDCTLIFYECNITEDLIRSWIKKRALSISPKIRTIYDNKDFVTISSAKTVTKNANSDGYGAVEMQPLNANLDEITSPTSKSKSGNVARGEEKIDSPLYRMERLKFMSEFDSLYQILVKTFLPILEIYNTIY